MKVMEVTPKDKEKYKNEKHTPQKITNTTGLGVVRPHL